MGQWIKRCSIGTGHDRRGAGPELWVETELVNGDPQFVGYRVVTPPAFAARMTVKNRGICRVTFGLPGQSVLPRAARQLEYLERDEFSKFYRFSLAEQQILRNLRAAGVALTIQLQWERERHGPQSPTVEQEAVVINTSGVASSDFTITTPTSGNTLIIGYGYTLLTASLNIPTSAGFTNHAVAGNATSQPVQILASKTATGSEGTTLTVSHNGTTEEAAGHFMEVSGLISNAFIAGSGGFVHSGSTSSRSSGNADTGAVNNAFVVASWGLELTGSPSGFAYSDSFTEEGSAVGVLGNLDHATKVATRTVATAGVYSATMSWTSAVKCGGVIAAFEIAPDVTVPDAPTGVVAQGESPTTVRLSWTPPSNEGGAPVIGYQVERESPTGGGFSTVAADTGTPAPSYLDTGRAPETEYNYKISAINLIGAGAASPAAATTTPAVADNNPIAQVVMGIDDDLPPLPEGSVLEQADRQHLLGLTRTPLIASNRLSLLAQQIAWYEAGVGI